MSTKRKQEFSVIKTGRTEQAGIAGPRAVHAVAQTCVLVAGEFATLIACITATRLLIDVGFAVDIKQNKGNSEQGPQHCFQQANS